VAVLFTQGEGVNEMYFSLFRLERFYCWSYWGNCCGYKTYIQAGCSLCYLCYLCFCFLPTWWLSRFVV